MFASSYFGARYFASSFFAAGRVSGAGGGYFGSEYFGSYYFRAGYYRGAGIITVAISAALDVTEAADTLESTADVAAEVGADFPGVLRRRRRIAFEPIFAGLDVTEKPDTCEAFAELGFNPVEMDNSLLLIAA